MLIVLFVILYTYLRKDMLTVPLPYLVYLWKDTLTVHLLSCVSVGRQTDSTVL